MWNAGGTSTPAAATTKLSSRGTSTDGARRRPPTACRRPPDRRLPGASTAAMVTMLFDQADQRDPTHGRRRIVLVDGANHQLERRGKKGEHRSAGPVDLLVAAAAEEAELTLLHYDRDFETIARTTGQPVRMIESQAVTPARPHGLRASLSPTALSEAARHRRRPAPLIDHRVHLPPPAGQWTRRSPGRTCDSSRPAGVPNSASNPSLAPPAEPYPCAGEHVSAGQTDSNQRLVPVSTVPMSGLPRHGEPWRAGRRQPLGLPRPPPRRIRP